MRLSIKHIASMQTICSADTQYRNGYRKRSRKHQPRVLALRRVDAAPFAATGLLDEGASLVFVLAVFAGGAAFVFLGGRPLAFVGGCGSGSGVGSCSESSDSDGC